MSFKGFEKQFIKLKDGDIFVVTGGQGFPLLLLHGYPQNHFMWHKIAPWLAEEFTVIATDLRGYGKSLKPRGKDDHRNYSKRIMAKDQVEVMERLGYQEFYLIGHDRGARVAHRLALDYPERVKKLALLDIVPTYYLYSHSDQEFARAYYHWFFLIQPFPFPETLISAKSNYFLENCLKSWGKDLTAFTPDALNEYRRCFNWETIHGSCEDYRASATIDLTHDQKDLAEKMTCSTLILWGEKGIIGRKYDVLKIWQKRAIDVQGRAVNCGHFLAEEAPEETYLLLKDFFSS
jgi:haloacetate dehalogenase